MPTPTDPAQRTSKPDRGSGISLVEVLDRLDRAQERASKERGEQAIAFNARIEEEAQHAQHAAETLVGALGQRVDAGFTALGQRISDQTEEMRASRKEMRVLFLAMLAIIGGLGGLNVAFPGGVNVSQQTDASKQDTGTVAPISSEPVIPTGTVSPSTLSTD